MLRGGDVGSVDEGKSNSNGGSRQAVNEMKAEKSEGWIDFQWHEKESGMTMIVWLLGLLNECIDQGVVPMGCHVACIVPRDKKKRAEYECITREVL